MISEYNVIFKFEGQQTIRKYYTRNKSSLYNSLNHDKELLTDHDCKCIIYDKKLNYIEEF